MGKLKQHYWNDLEAMYHDYEQEQYEAFDYRADNEYLIYQREEYMRTLKKEYDQCNLFFVYGTLQKNCGNHRLLLDAEFIAQAITKDKYLQTISGSIPYVNKNVNHSHVHGELYRVNTLEEMMNLDSLESHPNWYCREIITVVDVYGNEHNAWIYFNQHSLGDDIIYDGNYREFINKLNDLPWENRK